jgi:glycerol-3-phosphate acyltransferase PlsX
MTSPTPITLAVDCMGGDHGPRITLAACRRFLSTHSDARLLLVGRAEELVGFADPRAEVVAATEVVESDDSLEVALRKKKDSSMRVAIEQVRDGKAAAAVSAGNTGALMAIARYVLKTMDGIDRPAIAGQMPNFKGGGTTMLDLGANVDCTPEHLLQFAVMGSALVSVLQNKGTVDIVVCDGFVGNVALKASEGLATMIGGFLKNEFSRNIFTKIVAVLAYPVLSAFKNRVDHRRYNGAALLGLRGLVFKSHGSADEIAFETALNRAYDAGRNQLLDRVRERIAHAGPLLMGAQAERTEPAVTPL